MNYCTLITILRTIWGSRKLPNTIYFVGATQADMAKIDEQMKVKSKEVQQYQSISVMCLFPLTLLPSLHLESSGSPSDRSKPAWQLSSDTRHDSAQVPARTDGTVQRENVGGKFGEIG
jgi:hypothetical protein